MTIHQRIDGHHQAMNGERRRNEVADTRFCVMSLLRRAGLRPTRQRLALMKVLYGCGHRHITAEGLYQEVNAQGLMMSLATVYNALHQFTEVGLLRELAVEGAKSQFDTNVSAHHHFYVEGENRMIDIPACMVGFAALPDLPDGMEIERIDVVIRLRRRG